ncbi:MAG: GlsB/YeaQ/YmgE family stress response membrane protein [Planctomycetota bacterium]|nr:GlsB/YeaQ/YmgE family stress response membrane protein [Planctomycetota bacterium]
MDIDIGHVVAWLLVGGVAGALIGRVAKGRREGFGFWRNTLLGATGAVLGTFLFRVLGVSFGLDNLKITFNDLVAAIIGSLIVLLIVWLIRRGKKEPPAE